MAAIMTNTRFDTNNKFKKATGEVSAPVMYLSLETNWLQQGKCPLYLKGRLSDFSEFQPGKNITLINGSETLKATISQVTEDPHGWGMGVDYWVSALILEKPDKPFESFKAGSGGTVYLGDGPKVGTGLTKIIPKSNTAKYLFIGVIFIGAAALAWKYRAKLGIK